MGNQSDAAEEASNIADSMPDETPQDSSPGVTDNEGNSVQLDDDDSGATNL